jgi:hypothetical protein
MAGHRGHEGGPGWPFRSRSCVSGAHESCGHLGHGSMLSHDGRLVLMLCRCDCHAACALATGVPLVPQAIWVGLCTCPGTELAEARLAEAEREAPDFPDVERMRERREERARERQAERAAGRAAWEAARAAADGKSRAQAREVYVAELRARGLAVPSDLVLDAAADAIARNREKFSVSYSARVLAGLGRDFAKLLSRFGTDD